MTDVPSPTFSGTIDQSFFIEPLSGPQDPNSLLDRFPDELYDKSPDTHFIRFMYSLLGPAGVGWLSKNYLDARLKLFQGGFQTFDIEKFYGNPFGFSRILSEEFETDPVGLLPREQWDAIRAQDESYRNRSITFFNAARTGNTPAGMELAAQSGVDHPVEVIENYRFLFDQHSDDSLSLPYFGQTTALEEFIVLPRREDSRSEAQTIYFEDDTIVAGTFVLDFRGPITDPLAWDASNLDLQAALESLSTIGVGNVSVEGGSFPNPFVVTFAGALANTDVPLIGVGSNLIDRYSLPKDMTVVTTVSGINPMDEETGIDPQLEHNLQTAIDRLRPVPTFPTFQTQRGMVTRVVWKNVLASSEYSEVIRYVTGTTDIDWPAPDSVNWIEPAIENESRRIQGDLQHHYHAFHSPADIKAYTNDALDDSGYEDDISVVDVFDSTHIGVYNPYQTKLWPSMATTTDPGEVHSAKKGLKDNPDGTEVLTQDDTTNSPLIGGTVATSVIDRTGTFHISSKVTHWSSLERQPPTSDFLEIDFGSPRIVNHIHFQIRRKPIHFEIAYDLRDHHPSRNFIPVDQWDGHDFATHVQYDPHLTEWEPVDLFFRNGKQQNIVTRFIRIEFIRETPNSFDDGQIGLFTDPKTRKDPIAYSIDVRGLKIGRFHVPHGHRNDHHHRNHKDGVTHP